MMEKRLKKGLQQYEERKTEDKEKRSITKEEKARMEKQKKKKRSKVKERRNRIETDEIGRGIVEQQRKDDRDRLLKMRGEE